MEFYGDSNRWFIGKVAKINDDPSETARIKVKIFGLHDDPNIKIPDDLPWAQVLVPTTEGGGSGIGNNGIGIQPQSLVFGIFLDGQNSQLPLVLGSIPTNENFHQDLVNQKELSERGEDKHGGLTDAQSRGATATTADEFGKYDFTNIELNGSSNLERAWNWFTSAKGGGYDPAQTAGLLGNFWIESGPPAGGLPNDINPAAENKTKDASRGIAQWNPMNTGQPRSYIRPSSRLAKLQRWAAINKLNWLSLYAQLQWVTKELETMNLKGGLLRCKSPEQASFFVCKRYEVPMGYKNYNSKTNVARRKAAREIFDQFTTARN